jgi:hypothetical protein
LENKDKWRSGRELQRRKRLHLRDIHSNSRNYDASSVV